ncbi:4-hydroxythreonine-4-phosphate dehydrogenase PdxA [Massilia sp. W12]|uniref:4-hydroxythreonine-4-phosphate dehydrogenase PdxA n=1 Tax=Massilia sp. W12 TaxID=3126507 RepID=UPI0030CE1B9E
MRAQALPVLAISCGEPAGIGPEISLRAAWAMRAQVSCVLFGDAAWLSTLAADLAQELPGLRLRAWNLADIKAGARPVFGADYLCVVDCSLAAPVAAGVLNRANAAGVLQMLDAACDACRDSWCQALVTAPLQKSVINDAGTPFSGHTEYLAARCGVAQVVMMLAGPAAMPAAPDYMLRVALATTHLPLQQVSAHITQAGLAQTLDIIAHDLRRDFGLPQPRILVCGLNPHAGEGGHLGDEEQRIIEPAIAAARARGLDVRGPYPADTLFQARHLIEADCVLAMYHDQGLPVLKYATFGRGVNITLGLPIIRTSVDHGTALDLAAQGLGLADDGSMRTALQVAAQMARARQR